MIISYEGKSYSLDFAKIRIKQAIKIEEHVGMPVAEWSQAIFGMKNLKALQAVGWLILDGGDTEIADCDFELVKLAEAIGVASEAEEAAERPTPASAPQNGSTGASIPDLSLPSSPTG